VSVYPQVQLSVSYKPRVVYTSPVVIYDADPGIALGTSEPATPTLSIPITSLPPIEGVASTRYSSVVVVNPYTPADGDIYVKVVYGTKVMSISRYVYGGRYATFYARIADVKAGTNIDIYVWCSVEGCALRRTLSILVPTPIISDKVVNMIAISVRRISIDRASANADLTGNDILACHADVCESSLGGTGVIILRNNVIKPSILVSEGIGYSNQGSLAWTLHILYPSIIAWAE
jgi:hypothetical protein